MGGEHRRWPRVSQKTASCRVEGCKDICVGNDLCSKHNMALRRYGSIYGKPKVELICVVCNTKFKHKYNRTKFCSQKCYRSTPEYKAKLYQAVRRHRVKFPVKTRARDIASKRVQRGVSLFKELCSICGEEAEMHHPDYDKPLEIVWLCRKHHFEEHKRLKEVV